jgi:hypothetical protein
MFIVMRTTIKSQQRRNTMKYGDAVMYRPVQDGPVVVALVVSSELFLPSRGGNALLDGDGKTLPAEEHVTLVYLDPNAPGLAKDIDGYIQRAFSVRVASDAPGTPGVYPPSVAPPDPNPPQPPAVDLPSAEDLDAVAAEQALAQAPAQPEALLAQAPAQPEAPLAPAQPEAPAQTEAPEDPDPPAPQS